MTTPDCCGDPLIVKFGAVVSAAADPTSDTVGVTVASNTPSPSASYRRPSIPLGPTLNIATAPAGNTTSRYFTLCEGVTLSSPLSIERTYQLVSETELYGV